MPLWIDVLGVGKTRYGGDPTGFRLVHCQPVVAHPQLTEIRREPVRHECDLAPVGRPGWLQVGVFVVGYPAQTICLQVEDVEIREASNDGRKRNVSPVGRPRRIDDLAELIQHYLFDLFARGRIYDREGGLPVRNGPEHEFRTIRAPRTRGVEELQTLVVRIQRRLDDLALDTPRVGVGEEHLNCEEVFLG